MLGLIVKSGLFNTTLLLVLGGLAWTLWPRLTGRLPRWGVRLGLFALAAGTLANLGLGLYRSYAVPRDVLQDIIAAREFDAGRRMEPHNMNELARAALDEETPRRSLLGWSPELAAREAQERENALSAHWVQAHPPLLTLITIPFVRTLGILGTQIAFAILALVSLAWTLWLIRRELVPDAAWPLAVATALAVYGWSPVISVLRLQQPGLVLIALLTVAWAALRRERSLRAGVAVALAASLKVIPVLLVLPFLARHRAAFLAAVGTLVLLAAFVCAEVPWQDLLDYRATANGVVDEYASYVENISLLGMFARIARAAGLPLGTAKLAWEIASVALVVSWLGVIVRDRRAAPDVDREFAVGMSLMPLLSPVAWDHYDAFLLLPLAVLAHRLWSHSATRSAWLGFWAIVVVLSLPNQSYLAAYDAAREAGWVGLEVGVLEPIRTISGLALVIWLLLLPAARPLESPVKP